MTIVETLREVQKVNFDAEREQRKASAVRQQEFYNHDDDACEAAHESYEAGHIAGYNLMCSQLAERDKRYEAVIEKLIEQRDLSNQCVSWADITEQDDRAIKKLIERMKAGLG